MISEPPNTEQGHKTQDPNWTGASPDKPKRKKKRFDSARDIETAIDNANREADRLLIEAEVMEKFADVLRDFPDWVGSIGRHKTINNLKGYRETASKLRKKSVNLSTVKCKRLSRALAEIRTTPLLAVTIKPDGSADNSVQLQ